MADVDPRLAKQISDLKDQNKRLKEELTQLADGGRKIDDLKRSLEEKDAEIRRLMAKNKELIKEQRKQEKVINTLNHEGEVPREITQLSAEIRTLREQVRKYQERRRKDEELMKAQHIKLTQVSEKCKLLVEQLKEKGIDPSEQQDLVRIRDEIAKRDETISSLEKQAAILSHAKEAEAKKARNAMADLDKRASALTEEITRLKANLEVE